MEQPRRSHVAQVVLALGVQLAAEAQHLGRQIGHRAAQAALEVHRVVACAHAELTSSE